MSIKRMDPSPDQRAFRDALIDVMKKYGAKMDGAELLAVASHMVGQLIALQDQRKITPDMAMAIVSSNIEEGNAEAINKHLSMPLGRG